VHCSVAVGKISTDTTHRTVPLPELVPFWDRLTRVVLDKGPLNGCVCMFNYSIQLWNPLRYDMRCYFNVRSNADTSQID